MSFQRPKGTQSPARRAFVHRLLECITLFAAVHLTVAAGELQPVAITRYDRTIPASTRSSEIQVAAREVQVDVLIPDRKTSKGGALLVIFDSSSGLFLGRFAWIPGYSSRLALIEGFLASSKVALDSDPDRVFHGGRWCRLRSGVDRKSSEPG